MALYIIFDIQCLPALLMCPSKCYNLHYKYKKTFSKNVQRCRDESTKKHSNKVRDTRITKLNIHSHFPTSLSHVTACSTVALIYTVCHMLYQAVLELPFIPIVFIALVIKVELFKLQLTCEKDVGMGLCMFNFVILLSLHLV